MSDESQPPALRLKPACALATSRANWPGGRAHRSCLWIDGGGTGQRVVTRAPGPRASAGRSSNAAGCAAGSGFRRKT